MIDVSLPNGNIFSIDVFSVNQQHLVSLFHSGVWAVSGYQGHVEPAESKRGQGLFLVGWRYAHQRLDEGDSITIVLHS